MIHAMDLENECHTLESVEGNEIEASPVESVSHNNVENIKTHVSETEVLSDLHGSGVDDAVEHHSSCNSPASGASPASAKGHGLRKKWKRLRRTDVTMNSNNARVGNNKDLKRGLSGVGSSSKPLNVPIVQFGHNSPMLKNVDAYDDLGGHESSLESRLEVGSPFAAGTDSENSDVRSSKSSTATSAHRGKYEIPAVSGIAREKIKTKSLGRRNSSTSVQRGQQAKGGLVDSSKKHRGEQFRTENENFIFTQGEFSSTSNGIRTGLLNQDGEHSDEAEEVETRYSKKNGAEINFSPNGSYSADKGEESENHRPETDHDPLIESIRSIQSVQEALENEILKFREIGRDSGISSESFAVDPDADESTLFDEFDKQNVSTSYETQIHSLTQKVQYLQTKLNETEATLVVKESRVNQLEAILNHDKTADEQSQNVTEFENLFKEKIEAEVECLILTTNIHKVRDFFEQQESLVHEQSQLVTKLGETQNKAKMLKKKAQELDKSCETVIKTKETVIKTKEILDLKNKICKISSFFLAQLFVFFLYLVWRLAPDRSNVVPT